MNALHQICGVAILLKPINAWMVLGGGEFPVGKINLDGDLLQAGDLVGGEDKFDVVETVGKDAEGMLTQFPLRSADETVIHADGPTFDLPDGVRGGLGWDGILRFRNERNQKPGYRHEGFEGLHGNQFIKKDRLKSRSFGGKSVVQDYFLKLIQELSGSWEAQGALVGASAGRALAWTNDLLRR